MIWVRISVHDGLAPNTLPLSSTIIYLIWFTNSEYLLSGTIKAEWKDFVLAVSVASRLERLMMFVYTHRVRSYLISSHRQYYGYSKHQKRTNGHYQESHLRHWQNFC